MGNLPAILLERQNPYEAGKPSTEKTNFQHLQAPSTRNPSPATAGQKNLTSRNAHKVLTPVNSRRLNPKREIVGTQAQYHHTMELVERWLLLGSPGLGLKQPGFGDLGLGLQPEEMIASLLFTEGSGWAAFRLAAGLRVRNRD